jgi:26S proteasome regulatory subunit N13
LTDILSPDNISRLLDTHPTIAETIIPLLPPSLVSTTPTRQELVAILTAPQVNDAVASLESALRNGGLPGGMMRDLGLPESAGTSVGAFIAGLKTLKKAPESDAMETD